MSDAVLLDTCACLWLLRGDPMSKPSLQAIRRAQTPSAGVYVSAVTAWEVATLVSKAGTGCWSRPTSGSAAC